MVLTVVPAAGRLGLRSVAANLGWHRFLQEHPIHARRGSTFDPPALGSCEPWLAPWLRVEPLHASRESPGTMLGHGVAGQRPALPACSAHKEKPRCVSSGVLGINPGDDLLSHGLSHTTIGAAAFHFRVRDGIGWFHGANFTREAFGESHSSRGTRRQPRIVLVT